MGKLKPGELKPGYLARSIATQTARETTRIAQLREQRARTSAWNLWLSAENLYLSYTRNGIISTVAGIALVQYRIVHTDKAPFSGLIFLTLGGYFFVAGSCFYLTAATQLAGAMRASVLFWPTLIVNGCAPAALWGLFAMCFTEQTPPFIRRIFAVLAAEYDLPTDFRNRVLPAGADAGTKKSASTNTHAAASPSELPPEAHRIG